jgi:ArsR family transcriptional regulator
MAPVKSLAQLESLFLALADKTRLRILNLIGDDEICVGHLVEVLNESQPKVSRHLAYLRSAGLVSVRRDGKWMHYRIQEQENEIATEMLENLIEGLGRQEQMQKERRRLEEIGGVTRKTVKPKKAAPVSASKKAEQFENYIEPEQETFPQEEDLLAEPAPQPFQRQELETYLL